MGTAKDWEERADLKYRLTHQQDIVSITLRPDLLLWSIATKNILTVPNCGSTDLWWMSAPRKDEKLSVCVG